MANKNYWQELRNTKQKYCEDRATYKELRAACKKYVQDQKDKAKYGTKTIMGKRASKRAQELIKTSCRLRD